MLVSDINQYKDMIEAEKAKVGTHLDSGFDIKQNMHDMSNVVVDKKVLLQEKQQAFNENQKEIDK